MPQPSPSANSSLPPRITPDFIQIIAQTLPDLPPLAPELPALLASQTEYHLRTVIRLAKNYMHHSKRTTLTVGDISLACKRRDSQPFLGYRPTSHSDQHFAPVPHAQGLWVCTDDVVQLERVLTADLPPVQRPVGIEGKWIVINEGPEEHDLVGDVADAIKAGGEEKLHVVCARIEAVEAGPARLAALVAYVRKCVEENARSGGNSDVLRHTARVICAMFGTRYFGVEVFVDDLMQALLTCLLGRRLGDGDHWTVRNLAAMVLQQVLCRLEDAVVRGRVGKTIVAVLTDSQTNLESVYGAIRGLSAMGKDVFEMQMRPHLPALLLALERATDACEALDERSRELVEEKIAYVCRAIADVTSRESREDNNSGHGEDIVEDIEMGEVCG